MSVRFRDACVLGVLGVTALGAVLMPSGLAVTSANAEAVNPEMDVMHLTMRVRDFKAYHAAGGHPDFQRYAGPARVGVVEDQLGLDGKPQLRSRTAYGVVRPYVDRFGRPVNPALFDPSYGDVSGRLDERDDACVFSEESFRSWFTDTAGINIAVPKRITLRRSQESGAFVFDPMTDPAYAEKGGFFPIDDDGFGAYQNDRNFHFTTELNAEFLFERSQNAFVRFVGDDDVWLFIDGRLVLDMGSPHEERTQVIELDRLDWLEDGKTYRFDLFHAERRAPESSFRLETNLPLRGRTSAG